MSVRIELNSKAIEEFMKSQVMLDMLENRAKGRIVKSLEKIKPSKNADGSPPVKKEVTVERSQGADGRAAIKVYVSNLTRSDIKYNVIEKALLSSRFRWSKK